MLNFLIPLLAIAAYASDPITLAEDTRESASAVLIETLKTGTTEDRLRAARAMARIQSQYYAESLNLALKDKKPAIREEAAWALGQLSIDASSSPANSITAALIHSSGDRKKRVRAASAEALGKTGGKDAEKRLITLMNDSSALVRREAAMGLFRLRTLKRIPEYSTATVKALTQGIGDRDSQTRMLSTYAFSRFAEPRAISALLRVLRDEDAATRLFALRGLAKIGDKTSNQAGLKALSDSDAGVRTAAVNLLAAAKSPSLILAKTLKDPSIHVRAASAKNLANPIPIRRLLKDPSPFVHAAAVERLAELLKEEVAEEFAPLVNDLDWRIRRAVIKSAKHLPKSGPGWIQAGLKDVDLNVRVAALELADNEAVAAVLADPKAELEMIGTAVEAAGKDIFFADKLEAAYDVRLAREYIEVRESIVDAAKKFNLEPLKQKLLSDPAPSVRTKAAKAFDLPAPPPPKPGVSPFLNAEPGPKKLLLETTKGRILLTLFWEDAPIHCANIIDLAQKGVYNGTPWHRVLSNFVIQGADPRGTGWGDAGYNIRDEINRRRYKRGTLGMPKAGKDTGGAQIFITHIPTPHLDGRYTVFGEVTEGLTVIDLIEPGDLILKAVPQ